MIEFKPTPGTLEYNKLMRNIGAEAGTVYHEVQLTPRQLLAQRDALLDALEPNATPNGATFLEWIADRLAYVYGEPENIDFVLALRRKAHKQRNVIDKIEGK